MEVEFSQARAARYVQALTEVPEARAAELKALRRALTRLEVAPCRKIVELGAGHGFATMALVDFLQPDGLVVGVDNSPYMVDCIPRHHNVRPLISRVCCLDIESATVDLAVSLATFHHITHKTVVAREIKRILSDGGLFVIADVNHGTPTQEFFDNVVRKHCSVGHDWDFLDRSWTELIARRAGLEHIWSSVESTNWHFRDEASMLRYVADLLGLELDAARLKPLVYEWLQPQLGADSRSVVLPWSLGFHALRKSA
jgi:SAM-dependent methyltransferase